MMSTAMVTLDPYQSECPDNDLKVPQYEGTDSSAVTDESTLSSPHSLMDGTEEARWIVCKANESMREITPWDIGAGREEDKSVGGDDERLLHASSVLSSTASCILKSPTDNDEDNILDSYPDITSNSNTQKKPELSRLIGKMNISDDAPLDRLEDPATPPPTQFEARKKQLFSPSPSPRSPCRSPASPVYTPQLNISKIREHFDEDALPNIMCFQALSMAANYHPSSSSPPPSSIVIPMPTSSSRRHTTDGTKSRFIAAANRCPSFTMPEQRQQINPDVRPTSSSSRLKSAFQKLRGQSGAGADKQPSSKRGHNTVAPEPIDSFKEACPPFPVMTRPTKSSSFAERIKAKFQRKSSNKEGSNGLSRSTSLTSIAWPRRSDNKRPSSASTVVAAPPFVKPLKGILREEPPVANDDHEPLYQIQQRQKHYYHHHHRIYHRHSSAGVHHRHHHQYHNKNDQSMQPSSCTAHAPSRPVVRFARVVSVRETFSRQEYDRGSDPEAVCTRLTAAMAQCIKDELNAYKLNEMQVHEQSRMHTHFFL